MKRSHFQLQIHYDNFREFHYKMSETLSELCPYFFIEPNPFCFMYCCALFELMPKGFAARNSLLADKPPKETKTHPNVKGTSSTDCGGVVGGPRSGVDKGIMISSSSHSSWDKGM